MKSFKLMGPHSALQTLFTSKLFFLLLAIHYYCSSWALATDIIRKIPRRSGTVTVTTTVSPLIRRDILPTTSVELNKTEKLYEEEEEEETRRKRQLFREDIPHHRPLTGLSGNMDAIHHGFPLPGRFSNNPGNGGGGGENTNQLHEDSPGHEHEHDSPHGHPHLPPVIHNHHTLIYEHGGGGHYQHGHHPVSVEHGNEVVHQYPVEIGQYIQLDHDIKSGPIPHGPHGDIHPSQVDSSKPSHPGKLVGPEPGVEGHPHGHPEEEEEGQGTPYQVGHSPHTGGHYYSYAAGHPPPYGHHPHGRPYGPPSKLVHFLKTWPLFFTHKMRRTFWPYRRPPPYRSKVKHHHHYF